MYNYIKGTITGINANYITIDNNGLGFLLKTPNPFSFELDSEIVVYTYLHVREDIFDLYGFFTQKERDFFIQLISVKGLGPKGALAILASGNHQAVINAINNGDTKYLQKFPGIGAKASQQIILDLHGKINIEETTQKQIEDPKITSVKEALKNLGYKPLEIKKIIAIIEANLDKSIGDLIKLALKNM